MLDPPLAGRRAHGTGASSRLCPIVAPKALAP